MSKNNPYERKKKILGIVRNKKNINVEELAKDLNISTMTIYRDIKEMTQIILSKGNLVYQEDVDKAYDENPFEMRIEEKKAEKKAIAGIAVKYINHRDTIFLDGSSTVSYLAEQLQSKNLDLSIVTISPLITIKLAINKNFNIINPGGWFDKINYIYVKNIKELLNTININKAFISCGGYSLGSGFTDMTIGESQIKMDLVNRCSEINILADSSKYNKVTTHTWAKFPDVTRLFIDKGIKDEDLMLLNENISEVIVCE
jgi:DeoR/GlpR family transcriptional regulator of sugar metabolism